MKSIENKSFMESIFNLAGLEGVPRELIIKTANDIYHRLKQLIKSGVGDFKKGCTMRSQSQ
jgi:hypothetical protein